MEIGLDCSPQRQQGLHEMPLLARRASILVKTAYLVSRFLGRRQLASCTSRVTPPVVMLKHLRIAVTVLGLTACGLLVVLWVRSHQAEDRVQGRVFSVGSRL